MVLLWGTKAGWVTIAAAGMISIPCDPFLFLGSLQDHGFMCHSYSYNLSPQGEINIASFHATFLLRESMPEFVKDYILVPGTGDQEAKKLCLPLFLFIPFCQGIQGISILL